MSANVSDGVEVLVSFDRPPAEVYDYLADPANRPEWQSSLRRVERVVAAGDHPGAAGTTWLDVTVPGLRPRMRVDASEPPSRWVESGRWRGVEAVLEMTYREAGEGTMARARATVRLPGPLALGSPLLRLAMGPALRSDLRRASRILASRHRG